MQLSTSRSSSSGRSCWFRKLSEAPFARDLTRLAPLQLPFVHRRDGAAEGLPQGTGGADCCRGRCLHYRRRCRSESNRVGTSQLPLTSLPAQYHYNGQYATAPLIGSLQEPYMRKSAFAFVMVPTVIIGESGSCTSYLRPHTDRCCRSIGALYANVACKYVYRRIMKDSRHAHSHSVVGWGTWMGLQVVFWAIAFVLGETIPSMEGLDSSQYSCAVG